MSNPERRQRRRLDTPEDPGPRAGCIVTGAVLGIIGGVIIAFWGLPWLLNALEDDTTVALGEIYEEDARRIQVVGSERVNAEFHVELQVRSNRTWAVDASDWRLQISVQDSHIEALPPDPDTPETSLEFPLGEDRELLLRFPAPTRVDAVMERLHLHEPRVIFELQPDEAE